MPGHPEAAPNWDLGGQSRNDTQKEGQIIHPEHNREERGNV